MKPTIYFSLDIETLGSVAGLNPMISLGCVAFRPEDGQILATYTANIRPLVDLQIDSETLEWWKGFPEAFEASTRDARGAEEVMREFDLWVRQTAGGAIAIPCSSPSWDWGFVHYYLHRFVPSQKNTTSCGCVFGHRSVCTRTLLMAALGCEYWQVKSKMPTAWKGGVKHTHIALEDALGHAYEHINALAAIRNLHGGKP